MVRIKGTHKISKRFAPLVYVLVRVLLENTDSETSKTNII